MFRVISKKGLPQCKKRSQRSPEPLKIIHTISASSVTHMHHTNIEQVSKPRYVSAVTFQSPIILSKLHSDQRHQICVQREAEDITHAFIRRSMLAGGTHVVFHVPWHSHIQVHCCPSHVPTNQPTQSASNNLSHPPMCFCEIHQRTLGYVSIYFARGTP